MLLLNKELAKLLECGVIESIQICKRVENPDYSPFGGAVKLSSENFRTDVIKELENIGLEVDPLLFRGNIFFGMKEVA